ncbi:MAG: lipid-binding SYLF domain-containing protein [Bryobacteraceae bacterium]
MKMKHIAIVSVSLTLGALALNAATEADKRLQEATTVFSEVMSISEKSIPQDLLNKSECVVIVPGLKKGAFVFGGKYGRGFMLCRREGGLGWSAPAAIKVEGGSFGFQIGGSETDVIMLVLNKGGAKKLLSSKFTLGADASVAAGPVGRESSADTDAKFNAQILTYSRSRGAFAGIALQGATLRPDNDANEELYGKGKTNSEIVEGNITPTDAGAALVTELNKYSSRK